MSKMEVKYVKFVPDNLQEELDFIGLMLESRIIDRDNFVKMQGILELQGHIPNDNPENYDTGNIIIFKICGSRRIKQFIDNMKIAMPGKSYKISDNPIGKL